MHSSGYKLKSDLLAKGMTRVTKIAGVPFNFALGNIAVFAFVMLCGFAITHNLWCILISLGGLTICHLLMMILSLKDDRALNIITANMLLCPRKSGEAVNRYTSLQSIQKSSGIRENPVARHIPWSHLYNDHTVMTIRGELFQVLTLDGMNFHTEEDIDIDANKALRNRLLQQISTPELSVSFYTIKKRCSHWPEGDYTNPYARGFNERYRKSFGSIPRYINRLYIVLMHKSPLFKKFSMSGKNTMDATGSAFYINALKKLDDTSARIAGIFRDSHCSRLTTDERGNSALLAFLSELVNVQRREVAPPMQALNTFIPYTSHHVARRKGIVQIVHPDGTARFGAILSLKEYPDETHATLLDVLLRVDCELITTHSFIFRHAMSAKRALEKQQGQMEQTDDSEDLAEEIGLAIEDIKSGRAAFGEHHVSICIIADDMPGLEKSLHLVESKLNQEAGLVTVREEDGVELAFFAMLPGNHKYRHRQTHISSMNLAGFASLHNYPLGKASGNHWGEAITVLETVGNTPFFFNLHIGQVANSIFIGPMGSGKTFLLSALLVLTTKYGGWRYVFDKDRGMEIVVRALGGSYNILEPGIPSGMAPLQLPDTVENRAFNLLLLRQILSTTTLTSQDEKLLEKAVAGIYELEQGLRIYRNMAPFLGTAKPGSLRERFDRWHGTGQNAWLFDNETDSFFKGNRISGYDTGKLLQPEYEALSTPALMYLFHRLGECLDSSPTAVFIPEGWRALSAPLFEAQLSDWSRTPRKNNMALILDTQSPAELAASPAGCSITREAATQVYFANPKAEWSDYTLFNLTEREFGIIKYVLISLGGHFFLLKQAGKSVIARLPASDMPDDIAVSSGNLARVMLLDAIRIRTGDDPQNWMKPYLAFNRILESRYQGDTARLLPDMDILWEEVTCKN